MHFVHIAMGNQNSILHTDKQRTKELLILAASITQKHRLSIDTHCRQRSESPPEHLSIYIGTQFH